MILYSAFSFFYSKRHRFPIKVISSPNNTKYTLQRYTHTRLYSNISIYAFIYVTYSTVLYSVSKCVEIATFL